MRSAVIPAVFALSLLPAMAFAQASPQSAAAPPSAPAATLQATEKPTPSSAGGVTREQYIHRVEERAGQRAAAQFDQMDADHDGVLQPAEMRAWRSHHPRRARTLPDQPTAQ